MALFCAAANTPAADAAISADTIPTIGTEVVTIHTRGCIGVKAITTRCGALCVAAFTWCEESSIRPFNAVAHKHQPA